MSQLTCVTCGGEVGLRERYERLLDLLEINMYAYYTNNRLENDSSNPEKAKQALEISLELYKLSGKYWDDIPGETLQEKIASIESRRMYERDENGNIIPKVKEDNTIVT